MPEENQPDRRLCYVAAIQDYQVITTLTPAATTAQRIYLAGPMTRLPEHNFPAFHTEAARLRSLGYQVENPAEHGEIPGFKWADYLRLDLQKLLTCQAIALLPGWMDSKGARLEFTVATNLGMRALHAEHITGPAEIPT
ncbi:DUF4406 domain-containing protein [Pseudomonas aeruginosa]|uniref:DUF4406 domain-containing protein n=1 Tax=Pseudomonas aeruginosa TaxID=287 RepID=UPI002105879B|nr:DUF4406 domain-containing protein [Pseudomonas aeruginosa]UTX28423.1 DUF4406 domain-containing protein [Pseudomonas aeruginosa]